MSITEVTPDSGLRDVERTRLTTPAHRVHAESVIGPVAALLGVVGALLSVIGLWMPAFWGNEAASILSAERFPAAVWWDGALRTPYTQRSGIWDSVWPIAVVAPTLQATPRVWDHELTTQGSTVPPANILVLERLGYTISRRIPVHRTVVYELSRETP